MTKHIVYRCDQGDKPHPAAFGVAVRVVRSRGGGATTVFTVREMHSCNDPRHMGLLATDLLMDYEEAIDEAKKAEVFNDTDHFDVKEVIVVGLDVS